MLGFHNEKLCILGGQMQSILWIYFLWQSVNLLGSFWENTLIFQCFYSLYFFFLVVNTSKSVVNLIFISFKVAVSFTAPVFIFPFSLWLEHLVSQIQPHKQADFRTMWRLQAYPPPSFSQTESHACSVCSCWECWCECKMGHIPRREISHVKQSAALPGPALERSFHHPDLFSFFLFYSS